MPFMYEEEDTFSMDGRIVTIKGRMTDCNDRPWYWCVGETGAPLTWAESELSAWVKIEPFFEVGDVWLSGEYKGEVTHVDTDLRCAWAVVTYLSGRRSRVTVFDSGWIVLRSQVIKNRKV